MHTWLSLLHYDPLPPLLSSGDAALIHHARRELLGEDVGPPELLWGQKPVEKLLRRQQADGSWKYPGQRRPELRQQEDYDQLETYRSLAELVEKYALTQAHPALRRAAEFLFSRQTDEGDIRGIYGRQYSPNYTAAIMELLIKAGYGDDLRIHHGFRWLLSARHADGGWAIALRTTGAKLDAATMLGPTLRTDPAKPFSHLATGVVLRAFAAHPQYQTSGEASLFGSRTCSLRSIRARGSASAANTPRFSAAWTGWPIISGATAVGTWPCCAQGVANRSGCGSASASAASSNGSLHRRHR